MLKILFPVLVIFSFVACTSPSTGIRGKRCGIDYAPVAVGLYDVGKPKEERTKEEQRVADQVKDRSIQKFLDVDFSDLPAGNYTAETTLFYFQEHLPGQEKPNMENGIEKRGAGFKIAGIERKASALDDDHLKTDEDSVVEINCVRNFYRRNDLDKGFRVEMEAIRSISVIKNDSEDPKFVIDTASYEILDGFEKAEDGKGFIRVNKLSKGQVESKPSDYFKAGDSHGSDYTASLYEVKNPGFKNVETVYELHSELNAGTYTIQSVVVLTPEADE